MITLKGKTALITGSSRGIGLEIAKQFASSCSNVIINYTHDHDEVISRCEELSKFGSVIESIRSDVSDRNQVCEMVQKVLSRFGRIDILVNNAGIVRDRTLKNLPFEDWDRVVQVNLGGTFNCTKAVIPHMIEQGSGHIVNIASIVGQTGAFGQSNYSASKAGIIGFTKSCALELAKYGILVNAVCPGYVETDMLKSMPSTVQEKIRKSIPLGRFASAAEIARCVLFLVAENNYITGHCLNINGGLYM